MLFDLETASHLKPWLVRNLEPICDAEPGALADYILALLKHNAPESELRKELASQLEEFLEKEGPTFIDTLFTALRTKSYLPYSAASPPPSNFASSSSQSVDTGIPIPLDALLAPTGPASPERGRKRSIGHDEHDGRPAKGPRLHHEGQFSRYGRQDGRPAWTGRVDRGGRMGLNGRADYMDGGLNSSEGGAGRGMGPNGRGPYRPPSHRGICRDYHNNGYCARGAYCKYSHGEDAVIPGQMFPMNGPIPGGPMPFVPMLQNGMPFAMGGAAGAAYDPHERMDMRPTVGGGGMGMGTGRPLHSRPPIIPRGDAAGPATQKPGELPVIQDLTPQLSPEERALREQGGPSRPPGMAGPGGLNGMATEMAGRADIAMAGVGDVDMGGPSMLPMNGRGGYRGYRGGGPSGGRGGFAGDKGTFGGDVHSFRPERRNDKTLVVEKIPEDKLGLGAVNEWFKKFGTVTNVAVDAVNAKALVSFSNHEEALAAWKSEDAVFGNRFVKVFWHRPMEGHGQKGARMLAASAPLVANMAKPAPAAEPPAAAAASPATTSTPRKPSTSAASSALAAKQQLLEQQISEQKSLMAKLSSASAPEKKEIMARLRKLNEEMTVSPSAPSPATTAKSPGPSAAPAPGKKSGGTTPRTDDQEQRERERLDKELELHHAVSAVEGEAEESTEELKAKLAKLKAEAASLGLPEGASEVPYGGGGSYRPYRGRGRGGTRAFYRGAMRGGPPRASLKLDNRPKKLLVKGASAESVQAVRDWYETTGQVDSLETTESGDIIVSFKSRAAAEQGLAKGSNISTVGPVQLSWYPGPQSGASTAHKTSSPHPGANGAESKGAGAPDGSAVSPPRTGHPDEAHMHEEEVIGGWGGDDGEDQFGML